MGREKVFEVETCRSLHMSASLLPCRAESARKWRGSGAEWGWGMWGLHQSCFQVLHSCLVGACRGVV